MTPDTPPTDFVAAIGGHPLIAQLLWQRGLRSRDAARAFLDPGAYVPAPPAELPGMAAAVTRLTEAISGGELIRIWGDFDVDGQTATGVLLLGLRALGARADFTIPNRATHSHGLNRPGIAAAWSAGARVLLSCDCGVTDFEEVGYARALGLDVIITDHHDLGDGLPDALAVVNPKRLPPSHRLANLPGVGVAYKLIEALCAQPDRAVPPGLPESLLDLVALGIVADVAYQQNDTRHLLQRGLVCLRDRPRPGVRALMGMAGLVPQQLDAEDIGFQLGPRLNASGRLDSAELGVQLLTTQDPNEAQALAVRIEQLNADRRTIQRRVEDDARSMIERDPALLRTPVLVLQSPDWNASVIGVVASSLAHRHHKPAVLISVAPGQLGRGSARSVEGVDIHAAIAARPDLVVSSGGHPMAAGFAIHADSVPEFRAALSDHVVHQLEVSAAAPRPQAEAYDAIIPWREADLPLCEEIERLAPFGPGNPRPVLLSRAVSVVRSEPLGKDTAHQTLILQDDSGHQGRAVWWRSAGRMLPQTPVDMTFTLHRNVYQGRARAQVQIESLGPAGSAQPADARPLATADFAIEDARGVLDRAAELRRLLDVHGPANVRIFAEHTPVKDGSTRLTLLPASVLVIYDAPPSAEVMRQVLERARPQTVVLLTADPPAESPGNVLAAVQGMLKTAEQRGDSLDDATVISRMAARIGHREATVRACIANLRDPARGSGDELAYLLEETRGYRRYAASAAATAVLVGTSTR